MIDYDYGLKFGIDIPAFPHIRQSNLWRIKKEFPEQCITSFQKIYDEDNDVKEFKDWIDQEWQVKISFNKTER
ncbi:hypothetical protein ASE92_11995 [Pedobacter sp. Leaf41]|nr:hypothetical protein ASE92_11995 [Pedobacter sp. Leaf41]